LGSEQNNKRPSSDFQTPKTFKNEEKHFKINPNESDKSFNNKQPNELSLDFGSISTDTQAHCDTTFTLNPKKNRIHKTFVMTPRGAHSRIVLET